MNFNDKQHDQYWTERAEQRLLNAESLTEDMLKNLKSVYSQSIKAIEKEINAFYGKYATETGLDITEVRKRLDKSELRSFKEQLALYYSEAKRLGGYAPDTKQYLRELSVKTYISRLEELQANIRWEVECLYRQQQLRLFEVLSNGYEDTYYRTSFDVQKGIGFAYSFTALNTKSIQKAVTQKWQGSNFSNRIWNDKVKLINTLEQTIPQGFALGQNPRKVARNIAKTMETKFSNAERLARTEMNHIENQATKDAYKETPEVLQQYKISATLDNRTSDICQNQDGKVYKMSEWEEGVTAPPFHPNCRSTTVPYFSDVDLSEYTRLATDYSTGKSYYVPANMSYKEWRASLTEKQEKAFINDKKAREQYAEDKKQLAEYRKLAKKQPDLFEGMPTTLNEYQAYKYGNPDKYEILKENARIIRSEMR